MFTVFIEGLDVYAYHGVPAEERVVGHRYVADISLVVDASADATDEISETVDYAAVATLASNLIRESRFRTVERLAGAVADELLSTFSLVNEVTVTVRKPLPPMPFIAESAGATVARRR